jgi:hypothetical protein
VCLSQTNQQTGKSQTVTDEVAALMAQLELATAHGNDLFDQLNAALAVAHESRGGDLRDVQMLVNAKVATLRLERREKRFDWKDADYPPGVVPR